MLTTPLPKRLSSQNDDSETIRTIMFSLANIEQTSISQYRFALPIEAVEKAIVYPTVGASQKENRTILKDGIGMINFGSQTLTIVDLRQKFTTIDPQHDSSKFLVLFHTQSGELCGLPVKDAPTMLDISPEMIRAIPVAYREVNQLNFVSHMAIVPQENSLEPLQIMLLGLDSQAEKLRQRSNSNYLN